ncbi:hypothetical protein [Aliiroseovarius subalbicans]|uniref:hypothetical protein n=1 Tax=Aliiroseovarius subalbicans TaxID=2925840 RepID=UPI001F5A4F6B|nr:hypothetical protein [Aliiroseovarius subalbicans]MCI2399342.1 hypothetical protein [Aliiroseovarius subalbicans]
MILCCSEALIDMLPSKTAPGGAAVGTRVPDILSLSLELGAQTAVTRNSRTGTNAPWQEDLA